MGTTGSAVVTVTTKSTGEVATTICTATPGTIASLADREMICSMGG